MHKFRIIFILIILISSCTAQTRLSRSVDYLTRFIASDYFISLSTGNNDLALIDTIYSRSLKFNGGDYYEALLAVTFSVIPYNKVPIDIQLLHLKFNALLPCLADSVYLKKNSHLPKYLLFDSPGDAFGDKDKSAHFFGNAFLGYGFPLFDITKFLGAFVEEFEAAFEVQNSVDKRDMLVNGLGYAFGKALRKDNALMPSRFFLLNTTKYLIFIP